MTERITLVSDPNSNFWDPFVGSETMDLLLKNDKLTDGTRLNSTGEKILSETLRIMQICTNPSKQKSNETILVIGYIQSGKTMSFTTLAALARDNNFQVVIVLSGISKILLNQSTNRLKKDLRINSRYAYEQKWILLQNPKINSDQDTMTDLLDQWSNPAIPNEECKTILITVMKNGVRLYNLTRLLRRLNLKGIPALIIDDEGDQASLNTNAATAARRGLDINDLPEDELSTIYRRINELRATLDNHTYIQYTATPQANLFINILDRLSPNYLKLLNPGGDYTGGHTFFTDNRRLLVEIPSDELPTNDDLHEAPYSLLHALRIFFIGVAIGKIKQSYLDPSQRNRSMLIHPSRLQHEHVRYHRWVSDLRSSWARLLTEVNDPERATLVDEFNLAYENLSATVYDLPSFDEICNSNALEQAIRYTRILEINSRNGRTTDIIPWQENYSWILVGGQSLDRGFTVEGLTVTYMPRGIGGGNVDTLLQRARFYGYRKSYINYCRVFLDTTTIDSYRNSVVNEDDIRTQLEVFDQQNSRLNDWDRRVILDRMLNLCRSNVIYDDLVRNRFGEEWARINFPHDMLEAVESNKLAIYNYLTPKADLLQEDLGHSHRTSTQKHLLLEVSMQECLDSFLNMLRFTRVSDSNLFSGIRSLMLQYLSESPDETCLIYLMSARDLNDWTTRDRRLNQRDGILNLFQGKQPTKSGRFSIGEIYPGDREIRQSDKFCIQVHKLSIHDSNDQLIMDENNNVLYSEVYTLAFWIPESMSKDIISKL